MSVAYCFHRDLKFFTASIPSASSSQPIKMTKKRVEMTSLKDFWIEKWGMKGSDDSTCEPQNKRGGEVRVEASNVSERERERRSCWT